MKRKIKNLFIFILIGVIAVFAGERVDAASCKYIWNTNFVGSDTDITKVSGSQVEVTFVIQSSGNVFLETAQKRYIRNDGTYYGYQALTNDDFSDNLLGNGASTDFKKFVNATSCPKLALCWYPQDEEFKLHYVEANGAVIGCPAENLDKNPEIISSGFNENVTTKGCSEENKTAFESQYQETKNDAYDKYLKYAGEINRYAFTENATTDYRFLSSQLHRYWEEVEPNISKIEEDAMFYECPEITSAAKEDANEFKGSIEVYINDLKNLVDRKVNTYITTLENAGNIQRAEEYTKIKSQINSSLDNVLGRVDEEFNTVIGGWGESIDAHCQAVLGNLLTIIKDIFGVMKIAAPILLIFFGSLDFGKAVIANDDKAIKKAVGDFGKRTIAAVALFFVPWFIELMFSMPGLNLGIKDVLCGISKVVIR